MVCVNMEYKMKRVIWTIWIILMVSMVYAQEETLPLGELEEIPAPRSEGNYVLPPPENISPEEPIVYKTGPDSDDSLESFAFEGAELFGDDAELVILINESEQETYPPGAFETVRVGETNKSNFLTILIVGVIIVAIIIWLVITRLIKK